jgi:urea-proton symporter
MTSNLNLTLHHYREIFRIDSICWFSIPFSLATSLGLASTALMLPITSSEAGDGLVPPAVATELLGKAGGALILIMLFMAIVSTGSAEAIAVSSLVAYDVYREYMNPAATGAQILFVSRVVIVVFCLLMGVLSIVLHEIGVNLGWVYLFMGTAIGSAVFPLWNLMTWKKASGTGAIIAAWLGFVLAIVGWLVAAVVQSGSITVDTLGTDEVMLSGNLIAIVSSGVIHYIWSMFIDPQDYDFAELEKNIKFVDEADRVLTDDEKDPKLLAYAEKWITRRGYALSLVLIVIWPVLSIPAGVFTKAYFAFWVLIAMGWGFGASLTMLILPLTESSEDIANVTNGLFKACFGFDLWTDDEYVPTYDKPKTLQDDTEPHKKVDDESADESDDAKLPTTTDQIEA